MQPERDAVPYEHYDFPLEHPITKLIEAAEMIGADGEIAIMEGLSPDGRPVVFAVAVGDAVPKLCAGIHLDMRKTRPFI
jgi:hypothetical protein